MYAIFVMHWHLMSSVSNSCLSMHVDMKTKRGATFRPSRTMGPSKTRRDGVHRHWKSGSQELIQICEPVFSARSTEGDRLAFRGGGNVENPGADRGRPSLRWMVFEAGAVGLRTSPFERELIELELVNINESFTTTWRLAEDIAIKPLNLLMNHAKGKETTRK